MTLTSALLLVLEPGPVAPPSGVTLLSTDPITQPKDRLFDIPEARDWKAIIIHDSGTLQGSSRTINALDEQLGRGGLGYHFVINNGTGQSDGLIEVGFRWQRQFSGAYLEGEGADWYHRHAIGIDLIGDGDREPFTQAQLRELVWLVQQLQARFHIPRAAVYVEVGAKQGLARYFPEAWFRQQLLAGAVR